MRFEKYFIIWELANKEISLKKALKIAKQEMISEFVYDSLGLYNEESWWWCAAVLEMLRQEDWIHEFKIIKEAPDDQQVESKEGVVY